MVLFPASSGHSHWGQSLGEDGTSGRPPVLTGSELQGIQGGPVTGVAIRVTSVTL